MTVSAPETAIRQRVIAVLNTEFEPEEIEFLDDKLHDSKGRDGSIGGVYPGVSEPRLGQEQVLEVTCYVQIFGAWSPEVDPNMQIDPTPTEEWAERLRRALQADSGPGDPTSEVMWFYSVRRVEYPPDPTGNISRVLATIVATSQNSALVETTL